MSKGGADPYKEQQAKDQKKREQWTRAARASLVEVVGKADKLVTDAKWWNWALTSIAGDLGGDIIGTDVDIDELIKKKKFHPEMLLTLIIINDQARVPSDEKLTVWRDPGKDDGLLAGLKLLGVDYDKHLERIKESDKAAAKAEKQIAAKTEKPAKKKGGAK